MRKELHVGPVGLEQEGLVFPRAGFNVPKVDEQSSPTRQDDRRIFAAKQRPERLAPCGLPAVNVQGQQIPNVDTFYPAREGLGLGLGLGFRV